MSASMGVALLDRGSRRDKKMTNEEFFTKLLALRNLTVELSRACAENIQACNEPDITIILIKGIINVQRLASVKLPADNSEHLGNLAIFLDTTRIAEKVFEANRRSVHEDEDLSEELLTLLAMRREVIAMVRELAECEIE